MGCVALPVVSNPKYSWGYAMVDWRLMQWLRRRHCWSALSFSADRHNRSPPARNPARWALRDPGVSPGRGTVRMFACIRHAPHHTRCSRTPRIQLVAISRGTSAQWSPVGRRWAKHHTWALWCCNAFCKASMVLMCMWALMLKNWPFLNFKNFKKKFFSNLGLFKGIYQFLIMWACVCHPCYVHELLTVLSGSILGRWYDSSRDPYVRFLSIYSTSETSALSLR